MVVVYILLHGRYEGRTGQSLGRARGAVGAGKVLVHLRQQRLVGRVQAPKRNARRAQSAVRGVRVRICIRGCGCGCSCGCVGGLQQGPCVELLE